MAAATYRVGPSDFFLPGDLQADANTVEAQVVELDKSIQAAASTDFIDSWEAWVTGWRTFYNDNFGGFWGGWTVLNGPRDQLVSYEAQLVTWRAQAITQGATTFGPALEVSTGSGASLDKQLDASGLPKIASGLGGLATELIVGLIVAVIAFEVLK